MTTWNKPPKGNKHTDLIAKIQRMEQQDVDLARLYKESRNERMQVIMRNLKRRGYSEQ